MEDNMDWLLFFGFWFVLAAIIIVAMAEGDGWRFTWRGH
jgi:uncharacterized membrane protein YccF (DUF307 family)